jgi:hypothetical protein
MRAGEKGCADLIVMRGGRLLWLEVKAPGRTLEPHQAEWGEEMEPFAPYRWADSVEAAIAAVDEVFGD